MLTRDRIPRNDRALPTFITLLVLGMLLMTLSVRLEGGGVVGVMRTGTQAIISPLQRGASYVVNPISDAFQNLANIAGLREENIALRAALAEADAQLIGVQSQLARLELFEELYGLKVVDNQLGRTVAHIIGRPDPFSVDLLIDKGSSAGVAVGQPVLDTNGYVVGTVANVTQFSATIVPITASREGLVVLVGTQIGSLTSQIASGELRLVIEDAREPVLAGARVVTSAQSVSFPAGLPVGEVLEDAAVESSALSTIVGPYADFDNLELVVILAWPTDPASAVGQDQLPENATTTTLGGTTTTSEGGSSTTGEGG